MPDVCCCGSCFAGPELHSIDCVLVHAHKSQAEGLLLQPAYSLSLLDPELLSASRKPMPVRTHLRRHVWCNSAKYGLTQG